MSLKTKWFDKAFLKFFSSSSEITWLLSFSFIFFLYLNDSISQLFILIIDKFFSVDNFFIWTWFFFCWKIWWSANSPLCIICSWRYLFILFNANVVLFLNDCWKILFETKNDDSSCFAILFSNRISIILYTSNFYIVFFTFTACTFLYYSHFFLISHIIIRIQINE